MYRRTLTASSVMFLITIVGIHSKSANKTAFPLLEFMKSQEVNFRAGYEETLNNLCTVPSPYRTFSCDRKRCSEERRCCYDYLWDPEKPVDMSEYKERLLARPLHRQMACHKVLFKFSFLMVDQCKLRDHHGSVGRKKNLFW